MTRINIYQEIDPGDFEAYRDGRRPRLLGHFDPAAAEKWDEEADWDGHNNISVLTGNQAEHQALYRTSGGKWVLHEWSQVSGSLAAYSFITAGQARDWLLACHYDDAAERFFGPVAVEEDRRPPGRPAIGEAVNVRLGDLLPRVDDLAASDGISRAEAIRRLVSAGLGQR